MRKSRDKFVARRSPASGLLLDIAANLSALSFVYEHIDEVQNQSMLRVMHSIKVTVYGHPKSLQADFSGYMCSALMALLSAVQIIAKMIGVDPNSNDLIQDVLDTLPTATFVSYEED